jgi:hypothetical protein
MSISYFIATINGSFQSKIVSGEVSLTCEHGRRQIATVILWSPVTGLKTHHQGSGRLSMRSSDSLKMNTAHDGVRLGQALYKICERLHIVHKVCMFSLCNFLLMLNVCRLGMSLATMQVIIIL